MERASYINLNRRVPQPVVAESAQVVNTRVRLVFRPPDRVNLFFPYHKPWVEAIRTMRGREWHEDERVWSVPLQPETLHQLRKVFHPATLHIDPGIETFERNCADIELVRKEMRLRNYSHKTIKAYRSCIRGFSRFVFPGPLRHASNDDMRRFLLNLIEKEHHSASTVNQVINALRFLYVEVYRLPMAVGTLPRPRKERKLPVVLSLEEVQHLFSILENRKHRIMLMLVYSAGLRVGEVIRLRLEDVDGERMMIHVRGAKGKKDRYTILSPVVLEGLRGYWKEYKPKQWLFEGMQPGKQYSIRSAEKVFENAVARAGISKDVSIHSLRHAFATHMHEQGTDLRYIQELLGHESVRTTEIYTHVSRRSIERIQSPIDQLFKGLTKE